MGCACMKYWGLLTFLFFLLARGICMEQNVRYVKEPGITKVATKQDEGEKLTSNEQVVKETVGRLLQDELDKLQVEEGSKKEREPLKPEKKGDKPTVEDASKFMVREKPGKKWDSLTLLDELSPFSEEEEMDERSDSPSLQDETMEEKKEVEQEKQIPRPPQSLWSQCREKLRGGLSTSSNSSPGKRKISSHPFGYFSSFAKAFGSDSSAGQGKQMSDEEAQPRPQPQPQPQKRHPMLSRLFTFIVSDDQTKRDSAVAVESELEGDHARGPEIVLPRPEDNISESTKKEAQKAETSAKRRGAHKPEFDSFISYPGISSSVWSMGQHITHWKTAHHRGYHADQLTQDKIYKCRLLKHERDTKAAVPLPLQEVIEEEVLAILKATLVDYQQKLGINNPLTIQMEEAVDRLHLQLCARSVV
ncbi:uncharacterized protein LOC121915365 isoform X3 [Sceloporus undulatus]|uniref:uncharacterized protein LOC121915365 isoform X3 n=1 Tax=Sceloporus undulatus TaxID=8520 RepID=UPI001C4A97C6|nr:uncharacterized protein LOC121915365 isoform X3 [Sceloporus undulatus]